MSQVSGALILELDLDRLAERVAVRVVELLQSPGSDTYRRDDPTATGRRYGYRQLDVTDHGEVPL